MVFLCNSVSFNIKGFEESHLFFVSWCWLCQQKSDDPNKIPKFFIFLSIINNDRCWYMHEHTITHIPCTYCINSMPTLKWFPQWLHRVVWSAPSTLLNMVWICCWSNTAISRSISVITVMLCRWEQSSSAPNKAFSSAWRFYHRLHANGIFTNRKNPQMLSPTSSRDNPHR